MWSVVKSLVPKMHHAVPHALLHFDDFRMRRPRKLEQNVKGLREFPEGCPKVGGA